VVAAGHRRDFGFDVLARGYEERVDEIVDADLRLADQSSKTGR
jgi:hypothetical protein